MSESKQAKAAPVAKTPAASSGESEPASAIASQGAPAVGDEGDNVLDEATFEAVDENEYAVRIVASGRTVQDYSGRHRKPGERAKVLASEVERLERLGFLQTATGERLVDLGPRTSFERL